MMGFLTTHKDQITLIISLIGVPLALIAAFNGARTYVRTERWKRAEFLAKEMKEFFSNTRVQTALTLIDWGARYVKLLDDNAAKNGRVLVTREMQVQALLPHTLKPLSSDSKVFQANGEHEDDELRRFTLEEAAIRDCYDTFFDGLETFASYVKSDLISLDNLRPYLQYWIDDIHAPTKIADDAAWSAALATYMFVYRYKGVQWLFEQFNRSVAPNTAAFQSFLSGTTNKELAQALNKAAREAAYSEAG